MGKTAIVMRKLKIRYFSSLSPAQKDKSINWVVGAKFDDFSRLLLPIYKQIFNPSLDGCKMKYSEKIGCYFPLNLKQIIES